MNRVTYGPLIERGEISAGLDYYKPTMSQHAFEFEPNAIVEFTLTNRGSQRLADYVDKETLQHRLDLLKQRGFQPEEIDYFRSLKNTDGDVIFSDEYLRYLGTSSLPDVTVGIGNETGDLEVTTNGLFPLVTFWETVVMSEINEAYFEGYLVANGINPIEVYQEGDKRLDVKVALLQTNPTIKFADFGTRRHFSFRWQSHVLSRLHKECPENFLGTSNVALSRMLDTKPIGTFAHEMPMVYAGLADNRHEDIQSSHSRFLFEWQQLYGDDLTIALTDTFGTDYFFNDFTPDQAESWRGLRHDSGDPFIFGEKAIKFYKELGIDPREKTIVFSDGLDINMILALHKYFNGRINDIYGWGTTLTNDMGIKPLNIVMKATSVNGQRTVKLSDEPGKHTGTKHDIERYKTIFAGSLATTNIGVL